MFRTKHVKYAALVASITVGSTLAYANGMLPDITVRSNGNVEVHQKGVGTAKASPNPLSGPPRVEGQTGNKDIDNLVKNIDGMNHLPQEAGKAVGDAVETEVNKIIERLKEKFWAEVDKLKKQAMPYVYLAAAAFVLVLMLPGFIGSLFAIWVVRLLDRRRARKQERQLKKALSVVKSHADEIGTKLAA